MRFDRRLFVNRTLAVAGDLIMRYAVTLEGPGIQGHLQRFKT